tara:strand:+ start:2290 stop:2658 length:369 start_codon:yes stop_codon:yes gene_type:complete
MVYDKLLETCSKYCWTGLTSWQALADNYTASKLNIEVMQTLLSDHALMQRITFSPTEINGFLFGDHDYVKEEPLRNWVTVYQDLVNAGMNNRSKKDLRSSESIDWVLDGKIINLEPAKPPVL